MKTFKKSIIWGIFTFIVFPIFICAISQDKPKENPKDKGTYPYLDLFAEALYFVEKNYVDPVERDVLIKGAIEKMLVELDQESYMQVIDENYKDFDFDEFFLKKCGVVFYPFEGYMGLVSVVDNSPLYAAGLREGDIIRGIDDILVQSMGIYKMGIYEFYNLLYNSIKKDGDAKITYIRNHDSIDVTVKFPEKTVDFPNVSFSKPRDGYLCIKINSFLKGTKEKILAKLGDNGSEKPKGLILDLRSCGRGLLSESLDVADIFLSKEKIVTLKYKSGKKDDYFAKADEKDFTLPMVVMINGNTIGLPELVASSLKTRPKTKIFGEKSFGSGKYHSDINLDGKFIIHLAKAEFINPEGKEFEKNGITPDVLFEKKEDKTLKEGEDPFLEGGLKILESMI